MAEKTTALDAVKIQARAVIPIVRALERELGRERAHSIVGRAIADSHAEWQGKAVSARKLPSEGSRSQHRRSTSYRNRGRRRFRFDVRDQHDEMSVRGV